jgi:hypothetical protein
MLEPTALRRSLATFLGSDRYRKFIQQVVGRGRLRFWQAREWDRFVSAHPEFASSEEELTTALRVCHLHGDELQPDTIGVFRGCRDFAQSYIEARNRLFPNAALDEVSTEGRPFESDRVGVWFCPSCRGAAEAWRERRA